MLLMFDVSCKIQGDHLSGKPGNVRILTVVSEMSGILLKLRKMSEKSCQGKSCRKLFIVSCIFASILDFAELVHFILVSDHALLRSYPTTNNNTSTGMI